MEATHFTFLEFCHTGLTQTKLDDQENFMALIQRTGVSERAENESWETGS